jgi:hypothetical protein
MTDYDPGLVGSFSAFAAYFGAAVALTALFVFIYWLRQRSSALGNGAAGSYSPQRHR